MMMMVMMTTALTTTRTMTMPTTMTTTMRKTTKRTMKSTMTSIFRDRMSVYYAVGIGRADSAAHVYGELRSAAMQVFPQLKRQAQEQRAKERRRSRYASKSARSGGSQSSSAVLTKPPALPPMPTKEWSSFFQATMAGDHCELVGLPSQISALVLLQDSQLLRIEWRCFSLALAIGFVALG